MSTESSTGSTSGPGSKDSPSTSRPASSDAQLSAPGGANPGVSSVAMGPGLLAMAPAAPQFHGQAAPVIAGCCTGLSDAEIMLRAKAGDESAFAYLVQKYRRAMVSFMYRMSHNAA